MNMRVSPSARRVLVPALLAAASVCTADRTSAEICQGASLAQTIAVTAAEAKVARNVATGAPTVEIRLTPDSTRALAELTNGQVGAHIELRVDCTVIAVTRVRQPMRDGRLRTGDHFAIGDDRRAAEVAKSITNG